MINATILGADQLNDEYVKERALTTLNNMAEIVLREQMVKGRYMSGVYEPPPEGGPVCGGAQFCAVGALWIGAGFVPSRETGDMPGVFQGERGAFIQDKPGLALALGAMNEVCRAHAERKGWNIYDPATNSAGVAYDDALEALFESYFMDPHKEQDRDMMLRLILRAKKLVRKGQATPR